MARRRLLLVHLAAVTVNIVIEYSRELKGKIFETGDSFDFISANGQQFVGARGNSFIYFDVYQKVITFEMIHSLLALSNGDVACGLVDYINVYRGTRVIAHLRCSTAVGTVTSMAELPGGRLVTVSGGEISTWNLNASPPSRTVAENSCNVTAVLAIDSDRFVIGDQLGGIVMHHSNMWLEFANRHADCVTAFVKLGNYLVSSSANSVRAGTVRIWDDGRNLVRAIQFQSPVLVMCVLVDGRLVVGCNNHEITVWDPHDFTCALVLHAAEDVNLRFTQRTLQFAVLPNNELVVDDGEQIRIYR